MLCKKMKKRNFNSKITIIHVYVTKSIDIKSKDIYLQICDN